jgi:endonuclease-3
MPRLSLDQAVDRLQAHYGKPKVPERADPWEMILRENVAYLADDDRRKSAFETLKRRVGIKPKDILAASDEVLLEVTAHGIMPDLFVKKLRKCAEIAIQHFACDLRSILKLPLPKAKKALQKFPGIGEPGAEKILLFTRTDPVLALESNGLRVLVRLGFAAEQKSYATTYRLMNEAIKDELATAYSWLIGAYILLRRHGQELCRRSKPLCGECPLAADCEFFRKAQKKTQTKR